MLLIPEFIRRSFRGKSQATVDSSDSTLCGLEFFFAPLREPFVLVSRKGAKKRKTEARKEMFFR
jgi:hypothetical protein